MQILKVQGDTSKLFYGVANDLLTPEMMEGMKHRPIIDRLSRCVGVITDCNEQVWTGEIWAELMPELSQDLKQCMSIILE